MSATLNLTPTLSSLSFAPKSISLRVGEPVTLGRQGIHEGPAKEESQSNGYFSNGSAGWNPVSKEHAWIWTDHSGNIFIQDLNSSNGTYINGIKLPSFQPKQLITGDVLRLGISLRIDQAEMTPVIAKVTLMAGIGA